jgi:hypothetical protein
LGIHCTRLSHNLRKGFWARKKVRIYPCQSVILVSLEEFPIYR